METTTSPATQKPRVRGIGLAAPACGCTPQWLRIVIKNPERSPELYRRYLDYKASEAAAIDRLAKLEDLDIVDRLRHLEFMVASGNVPKQNRPRFALLLWELEKQTLPFPHWAEGEPAEPAEGDWRTEPPPAPAQPDPVENALRASRERQQAGADAAVEAAIQTLRERLAAGPAAKPPSAATPTHTIREPGQDAGRPVPLASDRAA